MLVLCSLQGICAADDLIAGVGVEVSEVGEGERERRGTGRAFEKMARVWMVVGVSFMPWVGAGVAVLDACAGRGECGGGVLWGFLHGLFGPGWGR